MKLRPFPKHGEARTVTRFAWCPVTLDNGTRIWLERYCETQRYYGPPNWQGEWCIEARLQVLRAPAMGKGWEITTSNAKDPQPPTGASGVVNKDAGKI